MLRCLCLKLYCEIEDIFFTLSSKLRGLGIKSQPGTGRVISMCTLMKMLPIMDGPIVLYNIKYLTTSNFRKEEQIHENM